VKRVRIKPKRFSISSDKILDLLEQKHSKSVFIRECKDGPTQGCEHFRMDAWVMNRSWANACVTAYEIKVSRSDFLNDNKWNAYLKLCNSFYFVCPQGLIDVDELPADVGLIHVSATGTRLFTKKKAPVRQVQIPEEVFRYILMCRVVVSRRWWDVDQEKPEDWKAWLEDKSENSRVGRRVSSEIASRVDKQVGEVKRENDRLKKSMVNYESVAAFLTRLGIEYHDSSYIDHTVQSKLKRIASLIPQGFKQKLVQMKADVERLLESLDDKAGLQTDWD
jgi:hypothetical protein